MSATPARSIVFNRPQIGVEATPGTAVPATKKMHASTVRVRPRTNVDPFRPAGLRFPTDSTPGREDTVGTIEKGRINLGGDIVYWLSSLLKKVAAPGTWLFDPSSEDPEEVETFTLERGEGSTGVRVPFVVCDSLEFNFSQTEADVSGTIFGHPLETGFAMTAGLSPLTKALAIPKMCKVEVGDAVGSLATLTKCLRASVNIGGAQRGGFYLSETQESYGDLVALAPTATSRIVTVFDSTAWGLLDDLRTSSQKFARITQYGPLGLGGGGSERYRIVFTFPFKFQENEIVDEEEQDSGAYNLMMNHDEAFGGALQVQVYNSMGSL
jgi:hypothetical protein